MAAKSSLFDATRACWLAVFPLSCLLSLAGHAQTAPPPAVKPPLPRVEPGLEKAVEWRWLPEASDPAVWGVALPPAPEPETLPGSAGTDAPKKATLPQGPPQATLEYTVAKGDSLYVIARQHGVTIDQIKAFNQMKRDVIVVGQVLRIPSLADIQAMAPPPEPAPIPKAKAAPKSPPKAPKAAPPETKLLIKRPLPSPAASVARIVLMQAYLDRQAFSAGPIDGTDGPLYDAALRSYEMAHPGELNSEMGQPAAVLREMGGAYAEYQLKEEDLRWITPQPLAPPAPVRKSRKSAPPPPEPPLTFEDLTAPPFLPYRSVWEFVAERYHCSESFLRRINSGLKTPVQPGALFFVPNVVPFEIENALKEPLQPTADPATPVTATIISNSRLEIRRSGKLIANLPVSVARPGLRGKGTWKILEAIARPRLVTSGDPAAPVNPPLVLPPGPNNPVGPIWIHLAKGSETTPLPYGLHGTSIPGYMTRQESVGGFRMTNWDIARATRLLPMGTPLTWE
ncbi:MAG: LysM peptidoglycan-binding domain-containing protein [Verrucomicrobiota bacterium]